jgi:hypothetical protein
LKSLLAAQAVLEMSHRINPVILKNAFLMMNPSSQKQFWVKVLSNLSLSLLSWSLTRGLAQAESAAAGFWPQWRGPVFTGVAPHADPPVTWSETNTGQSALAKNGSRRGAPRRPPTE